MSRVQATVVTAYWMTHTELHEEGRTSVGTDEGKYIGFFAPGRRGVLFQTRTAHDSTESGEYRWARRCRKTYAGPDELENYLERREGKVNPPGTKNSVIGISRREIEVSDEDSRALLEADDYERVLKKYGFF